MDITGKAPGECRSCSSTTEASIVPFPELAGRTCLEGRG